MTDDDIAQLPPELWQPAIAAAVRYFANFGEPGSPGNRRALFDIVKVIIRYSHADEAVPEPVQETMEDLAA